MSQSRVLLAFLLATACLLAGSIANAQVGIEPVPDQSIPSGKTLVVPIPASDPGGPARTYTVTVGAPTVTGTTTPATNAGINAVIRTGDPHLVLGVSYSDSNAVTLTSTTPIITTGTMEFQLLREFAPQTTSIIAGLTQGGFYSPITTTSSTTYVLFHRVLQGQIIQAGDPLTRNPADEAEWGDGGPGFSFPNEYHPALIFSGTAGQLAMANGGPGIVTGSASGSGTNEVIVYPASANNGTNGCQFFVTLYTPRQYDFQYTLFGQLIRGWDTLFGIAATPVEDNGQSGVNDATTLPVTPVQITSATITQNNTDAVLLLSATGVCSAPVTITVTTVSGGTVTTATTGFTANAVADTTNDPAFIQPSPPDIAAPNGTVKVPISATDLQRELLDYSFYQILPVVDTSEASGTSPIISVPLVSNTSNAIAPVVAHWNNDGTTDSIRVFHAGSGSKALTGTLSIPATGSEGQLAVKETSPLAVINDPNPGDVPASFSATVIWGDGSAPDVTGTGVTILKSGPGRFNLYSGHTYGATTPLPGQYPVIVRVNNIKGDYLTLTGTANVPAADIAMTGDDVTSKSGILKNQLLATFLDNGSTSTAADYTAQINWGDGVITNGVVRKAGKPFQVLGTHTYQGPAQYTIAATVTRTASYSGSAWTLATVTGTSGPQVFPPFQQIHLAQMWTVLYSDSTSILTTGSSGGSPTSGLVQGSDGNFYGTTPYGGANAYGTVYQVSSSGSFNTLYSFTGGADGANPRTGLVEDGTTGTFYGTTFTGGANSAGVIYSITSSGSFNTLYSFSPSTDGGYPEGGSLVADGTSAFYGTTGTDGEGGAGTVFKITPSGTYTVIYPFTGGSDGGTPLGGVITGTDGNLYGTTETDGTNGVGTIYKLTPSGTISPLYTFLTSGTNDGKNPFGGLVSGTDGNFYGTTLIGGTNGEGTVYQISYSGTYKSIYSFSPNNGDATAPRDPLIAGTNGLLYGTGQLGANGYGGVFQVDYQGDETLLYGFQNGTDGANPFAPLVTGTDGNLYGTAETGGTGGYGTVYQVTPAGSLTPIYSFAAGQGFQFALRGGVQIVNSGNKPLLSGSGTLTVYANSVDGLDGNQTALTFNGDSVIPIPALQPGQATSFEFQLLGSFKDTRLKLPFNFDPTGQYILGVVTYSDPVGDFDGAVKVVTPGNF